MKKTDQGFTQPFQNAASLSMKGRAGFTFLELLLAVTIFSIIAVVLYSSFNAGVRILRRSEELMRFHQDLRLAMEEMALDLRNSVLVQIKSGMSEEPADDDGQEKEKVYYFLGDRKSFTFVTLRDSFALGAMERVLCQAKYYYDGEKGGRLMRSLVYQGQGFAATESSEQELMKALSDIEITYGYEAKDPDAPPEWLDYWEQEEKIPLGVKVKLKLVGLGRVTEFTKTVYIDTGALGTLEEETAMPVEQLRVKGL